ncbi:MAG: hypothetical protein ACXQS7_01450 [Candidatus Syntropharchaeia archaeon]
MGRLADFCANTCPVCTRARDHEGLARAFVKHIDRHICPACRAYEREYNKPAYE